MFGYLTPQTISSTYARARYASAALSIFPTWCRRCFDDFLLRRLARALADRTAFPRFCALVSLRALPSQPHLAHVGTLSLACSWNAAVSGHVYVPADLLERPAAERQRAVPLLAHCLCDASSGTCVLPHALQPWAAGSRLRLPRL